jgi:hypothetical protein
MSYDLEKFKEKREKVLGLKKRGLTFGTFASIIALCIVLGFGVIVVPKSIAYLTTRNLDDAIYKMADSQPWDPQLVTTLSNMDGVRNVVTDNKNTRLVVTFSRIDTGTDKINALFERNSVQADMLNKMDHRSRMTILEKEAEFEAL